jgi:hypothetical protein
VLRYGYLKAKVYTENNGAASHTRIRYAEIARSPSLRSGTLAPFRHNGFGNNSGSARRSLTLAASHNTEYAKLPVSISPLRFEIPPATSLIPKPLSEILLFKTNTFRG